jgi:hypothetical protein
MKKNFLIFISILILDYTVSFAENKEELPALPSSFGVQEDEGIKNSEDKSIWQKIKSYIGFGADEKPSSQKQLEQHDSAIIPPIEKTKEAEQRPESKGIDGEKAIDKITSDNIAGNTDEGLAAINLPRNSGNEVDSPDQLKLPEGFDEDPANKEGGLSKLAQGVNNLDNTPLREALEDKAKEASNLQSMPETPKKAIEELSTPQLPEMIEDKAKASNIQSLPETPKKAIEELSTPQLPEALEDKAKEASNLQSLPETPKKEIEELSTPQLLEMIEDKAKEASNIQSLPETPKKEIEELSPPQLPEMIEDKAKAEESSVSETATPTAVVEDTKSTIPQYADTLNTTPKKEIGILKYKREFEVKNNSKLAEVPKISESELSRKDKSNAGIEEDDPKQLTFVSNEAQVLILPNDDIVLGVLTEEAELDQTDFRSYITKFWDNYNRLKREPKHLEIERFIDNYQEQ